MVVLEGGAVSYERGTPARVGSHVTPGHPGKMLLVVLRRSSNLAGLSNAAVLKLTSCQLLRGDEVPLALAAPCLLSKVDIRTKPSTCFGHATLGHPGKILLLAF